VSRVRDERGAAIVEFALVVPIFFVLVLGAASLLWLVGARSAISGAAADGARFASIAHDPLACTSTPCSSGYPTQAEVEAYVRARAGRYGIDAVTVTPPLYRNQIVTVKVERRLHNVFADVLHIGDPKFVTTAEARSE
jgi:Flp pilus assembly protein TadG